MIRYYRYPEESEYISYYYALEDIDVCVFYDGEIDRDSSGKEFITDNFHEVFTTPDISPDAGPIEDFYINATDRPHVEGFKYPELGAW